MPVKQQFCLLMQLFKYPNKLKPIIQKNTAKENVDDRKEGESDWYKVGNEEEGRNNFV